MLQIIGFLICFAIGLRLFELQMGGVRDAEGTLNGDTLAVLVIGWIGVVGFVIWLFAQGAAFQSNEPSITQAQMDCMNAAKTADEIIACGRE